MKVLIADSSPIFRERLVRLGIEIIGDIDVFEARNYQELREIYTQDAPSLIFVDIFLDGGSALRVLDENPDISSNAHVVVLLNTRDESLARQAKEKGARAVYLKSDDLIEAMSIHQIIVPVGAREALPSDHHSLQERPIKQFSAASK